jgi:hypothetical protein
VRAQVEDDSGLPRTEREAKLLLQQARRAIRIVLEDRGLIPGVGAVVEENELEDDEEPGGGDRRRGGRAA